jgi:heme exporter protein A
MKKKLLFEVNELECTRDLSSLFNPISFKLYYGDLLVIKGSNGSGKTSFLHCLVGLVPFKGGITWHIEKSAIGYVGHKIAVKDHDTVKDFLSFWTAIYNSKENYNKVINLFSLSKILYTPISFLSFGQKKKLAFVRLYLLNTKIWLLDEPFSGMDHNNKKLVSKLIKNHNNESGAVIISTHEASDLIISNNMREINIV